MPELIGANKSLANHIYRVTRCRFIEVPRDRKVRAFYVAEEDGAGTNWRCWSNNEYGVFWCIETGESWWLSGDECVSLKPGLSPDMCGRVAMIMNGMQLCDSEDAQRFMTVGRLSRMFSETDKPDPGGAEILRFDKAAKQ